MQVVTLRQLQLQLHRRFQLKCRQPTPVVAVRKIVELHPPFTRGDPSIEPAEASRLEHDDTFRVFGICEMQLSPLRHGPANGVARNM